MLWFLRLFPAFRALEAELRAAGEARIAAEDRVRHLDAELSRAWAERDAARRETIDVLKGMAQAPQQPVDPAAFAPRGIQGRALVRKGYEEFIKQAAEQFDAELNRE